MNKEKIISYIQLINTSCVGPINFKRLMERYHDVDKALSELSQKRELFSRSKAAKEVMTAEIKGVKIITIDDDLYPYNLKQIEDCPPVLYALGDVSLLQNDNALAVVGSRNASFAATKMAKKISEEVSKNDVVIVSGMARGIDASSHEGALIVNGKAVKYWEIEPISVEEVNHEFVLKDYITSLTVPLQAEITALKEQNQTLLNAHNELATNHNELALIVKAIKENY